MEYRQQLFNIWAPQGGIWTQFAKPVLFYSIDQQRSGVLPPVPISYVTQGETGTAIILDTPGALAIEESLSLARLGFRPVPLFNGNSAQSGQIELVETASIKTALCFGGSILPSLAINQHAAPVFLLDSNRLLDKYAAPGMFDNRWNIYAHDLPSAEYFLRAGIKKIIIRNNEGNILADLAPILFDFQQRGIEIFVQQSSGAWQQNENEMGGIDDASGFEGDAARDYDSFVAVHPLHVPVRTRISQPGFFARMFGKRTYSTKSWNSTGGWGGSKPCHGYGGKYGGGYRGGYRSGGS